MLSRMVEFSTQLNDSLYNSQVLLTDNRAHVLLQGGAHGVVDEGVETGAEGARTRRAADHVLQDQVPANQEGHELADGHVTVHVGRTCGFRYSHSELAITHTCGEEKGFMSRYVIGHGSRVSDIRNTIFITR